eukprot:m.50946 g.50946  ORF g.50946 m.50946 type:complete len:368 (-) comp11198_c0_seq2:61-1164(-)
MSVATSVAVSATGWVEDGNPDERERCLSTSFHAALATFTFQTTAPVIDPIIEVHPASKWCVGDLCQAPWAEDAEYYDAEIVSIDTERQECVVTFVDYEEEQAGVPLTQLNLPSCELSVAAAFEEQLAASLPDIAPQSASTPTSDDADLDLDLSSDHEGCQEDHVERADRDGPVEKKHKQSDSNQVNGPLEASGSSSTRLATQGSHASATTDESGDAGHAPETQTELSWQPAWPCFVSPDDSADVILAQVEAIYLNRTHCTVSIEATGETLHDIPLAALQPIQGFDYVALESAAKAADAATTEPQTSEAFSHVCQAWYQAGYETGLYHAKHPGLMEQYQSDLEVSSAAATATQMSSAPATTLTPNGND